MSKALFALPIVVLALSASASAVTTITTTGAWGGSNFALGFGNGEFTHLGFPTPATSTYGQTFVAPADSYLLTYTSKFAYNSGGTTPFTYRLYIAAWSDLDNDAVGTALFQSAPISSVASTVTGFQDVAVNVNTQLVAGTKYVAFYSTTQESIQNQGSMKFAIADSNAYLGGDFGYSGSDYNTLFTDGWTTNYTPNDTVFTASFTTIVPEPAPMLGLGLGALVLLRRRRK